MATLEPVVKQVCHTKTGLIIICIIITYIASHRYPNINCMFYCQILKNVHPTHVCMVHARIMLIAISVLVMRATLEQIVKQVCHIKMGLDIIKIILKSSICPSLIWEHMH